MRGERTQREGQATHGEVEEEGRAQYDGLRFVVACLRRRSRRGSAAVFCFEEALIRSKHSYLYELLFHSLAAGLQLQLLRDFSGACTALEPFNLQIRGSRCIAAHTGRLPASERRVGCGYDLSFFVSAPAGP